MKKIFTLLIGFLFILGGCVTPPPPSPDPNDLRVLTSGAAVTKVRPFTCLTGGTAGCLDDLAQASINADDIAFVIASDVMYVYQYDSGTACGEDSPFKIQPDDCSGNGVWLLSDMFGDEVKGTIEVIEDSDGASVTKSQCFGSIYSNSGANTYTLPAVAAGYNICFFNRTAATMIIDVDGSDEIVLDGTDLTNGYTIENTSAAAGDYVCLTGLDAVHWLVWGSSGTWADGGET